MNAKAVALMIVGIVLVSFVFSYFHVGYPTGIPDIKQDVQVFQIQGYNGIGLGNGKTTISPQGKADVVIQGYIKNASSNSLLDNSQLFAFVSLADTSTFTSSSGFYQITVLYSGTYTMAFKVYSYKTQYVSLSVFGNTVWNNMSFTPAHRFPIEGKTVGFNSVSTVEPDISMNLHGFFGQPDFLMTKSNSHGYFNISAYNDSYYISVTTPQYGRTTIPSYLNVSGPQKNLAVIQVLPLKYYSVSGYILNNLTKPVPGATVMSLQSNRSTTSNGTGYYNLTVQYGSVQVSAYMVGFGGGMNSTFVSKNLTDFNITLININPFSGQSTNGATSGTGVSGIPPSAGGNISKALQGNTSSVNYAKGPSNTLYSLSGNVTDGTTGQKVVMTHLRFYLNVNGTIFYENITTNGTGYYHLVLQYPGSYTFVVYSPFYDDYQFSYKVTGNQYKNFNLTPFGSHVYTVTGYVKNKLGTVLKGINVSANYVYSNNNNNVSTEYNITDAAGEYSLRVFEANYTFSASGLGYSTNYTTVKYVYTNMGDVNITLPDINPFPSRSGSGISGVNGSQLSNLSSFLSGPGSDSTVFYNESGGPGKYNITGTVTNSNDSLPVFNTQLEFFANVSGTVYHATVTTGSRGQYVLNLSYKGNYTLAVYSQDYYLFVHNFAVTGTLAASFNMTPLPKYVHIVSGTVLNLAGYPVNMSSITVGIDGPPYYTAKQNSTNSTGNYSIYLVNDSSPDYSLHFSAPGYYNNTSPRFSVISNYILHEVMTPLASIGNGIEILSASSSTGSPSISNTSLIRDMGTNSYNRSYATTNNSLSPILLNISLNNLSISKSTGPIQFIGYIKIDGAIYRFVNYTDSSGYYNLKVNLSGTIAMLISTLAYKNSSEQFSFNSTANHANFNLSTAARYQDAIHLNSTYNSTWQIPDNLSLTNSLFSMHSTEQSESNGTNFTYYVQNGTYDFAFVNISYVHSTFYSNISGANASKNLTLINYILKIENNSVISWDYGLTPNPPYYVNHRVVKSVTYVNLTNSSYEFIANFSGSTYGSKLFTLTYTTPEEVVKFNVSSETLNQTKLNSAYSSSTNSVLANITITAAGNENISVFEVALNMTWENNDTISLYIDNSLEGKTVQNTSKVTNLSLSTYYHFPSRNTIRFNITGGALSYISPSPVEVVYYYLASLSGEGKTV